MLELGGTTATGEKDSVRTPLSATGAVVCGGGSPHRCATSTRSSKTPMRFCLYHRSTSSLWAPIPQSLS